MAQTTELQRTKLQLAELIDEVVFAEDEKSVAEDKLRDVSAKLEAVEGCLQNFIAYTTSLEHSVVLPAVRELAGAIPDDALSQRSQAMMQLDALQNLSSRTAKLILSLRSPSAATVQRIHSRCGEVLNAGNAKVDLEQAYVLIALLLDSKDELRVLIDDTMERVVGLRGRPSSASSTTDALSKAETQKLRNRCRELEAQVAQHKETISAIQSDREVLMAKAQHMAPFKALQEQYHSERESLITRLRGAESECKVKREEITVLQEALDATKRALDETTHERVLLEDEMSSFRRGNMLDAVHGEHSRGTSSLVLSSKQRNPRFWEEQAHRAQMDLEESQRAHSTVVSRLEGQVAQLRMELAEARERRSETIDSAAQIDQLRRANAAMQEEVRVLQQHFLSSSSLSEHSSPQPNRSKGSDSSYVGRSHGDVVDERIETFEMTIRSLHKELAHVEGKVQAVEDHYVRERERMVKSYDEERRRAQQEREECDALVLRMGVEMEQLVKENDALRSVLAAS